MCHFYSVLYRQSKLFKFVDKSEQICAFPRPMCLYSDIYAIWTQFCIFSQNCLNSLLNLTKIKYFSVVYLANILVRFTNEFNNDMLKFGWTYMLWYKLIGIENIRICSDLSANLSNHWRRAGRRVFFCIYPTHFLYCLIKMYFWCGQFVEIVDKSEQNIIFSRSCIL